MAVKIVRLSETAIQDDKDHREAEIRGETPKNNDFFRFFKNRKKNKYRSAMTRAEMNSEVSLMRRCDHPNVVKLYNVIEIEDKGYVGR